MCNRRRIFCRRQFFGGGKAKGKSLSHLHGLAAARVREKVPHLTRAPAGKESHLAFVPRRSAFQSVEHGVWVCAGRPFSFGHGAPERPEPRQSISVSASCTAAFTSQANRGSDK